MDITLSIIQDKWKKYGVPGTELKICGAAHNFYKTVRLLTGAVDALEDAVLYLVMENSVPQAQDNPKTGILFVKRPEEVPNKEAESAWIQSEQEQNPLDIFNSLLAVFDYFHQRERKLQQALVSQNPLQQMLDIMCEDLGNPAYIIDQSFKVLVMDNDPDLPFYSINWKRIREHGYLPFHVVSSILQNEEWSAIRDSKEPILVTTKEFSVPFLAQNLWVKGQIRWQLFVCEILRYITPGDIDLIRIFSKYLLEYLTSDVKYSSARRNYHEHFFREVLTGELKSELLIKEQLEPLGWRSDGLYCVLELQNKGSGGYFYEAVSSQVEQIADGKALLYEDRLLTVFALTDFQQYSVVAEKIRKFLNNTDSYGALSDVFSEFIQLGTYARQTQVALSLGRKENAEEHLLFYKDYALQHFLSTCSKPEELDVICQSTVFYLEKYDRRSHSNYANTLYEFIRNDRNLVKTAAALHIHRNTLVYRMEKIEELIPLSLDDPDFRFRMLLSYEIRKYI